MKSMLVKATACVVVLAIGGLWAYWSLSNTGSGGPDPESERERLLREAELDPKKQKQIWDMEHLAFQLEQRFGRVFLQAILEKKTDRLQFFALNDFHAKLVDGPGTTESHGILREIIKTGTDTSVRQVTKAEWAEHLATYARPFDKITSKTFRVLQLHQDEKDPQRWKAMFYVNIFGTNDKNQPVEIKSKHLVQCRVYEPTTVAATAILESWNIKLEVFRKSQQFLMTEVTKEYGLDTVPIHDNWKSKEKYRHFCNLAVEDFNRDGYLDIAVGLINRSPMILQSVQGKRFRDVATEVGIVEPKNTPWAFSAPIGWIDFDNDGYPDLVVGKRLFRNVQGKRFEDVSANSGLDLDTAYLQVADVTVADYDCDGFLDLYFLGGENIEDDRKRRGWVNDRESGKENQLFRNLGNGRFQNVTKAARAGGGKGSTFAAAWFFYDDDRYPDLFIANDFCENVLLRNRGDGTFEDVSAASGATGFATSMGSATGDIDNDGQSDIYVANMFSKMGRRIIGQLCDADYPVGMFSQLQGSCAGNRLYLRKGSSVYRDYSIEMGVNAVGWAFAPAMFDVDGDGWLDLYATTGYMSAQRDEPDG